MLDLAPQTDERSNCSDLGVAARTPPPILGERCGKPKLASGKAGAGRPFGKVGLAKLRALDRSTGVLTAGGRSMSAWRRGPSWGADGGRAFSSWVRSNS